MKEHIARYLPAAHGRTLRTGIGCAYLGRSGDYRQTLKRDLETLDAAYESGFRYFDTANAYGESELTLGEFLQHVERSSVFIATKSVLPHSGDRAAGAASFRDSFERSFDRLRVDTIDLFQIHETPSVERFPDILEFLRQKREEGRIRYIGLGTYLVPVHLDAIRRGYVDSVLLYLHHNPMKLAAEAVIAEAAANGVAFINATPLANGFLTDADPALIPSRGKAALERRRQLASELHLICRARGASVLAVALQYPGRHPDIDITLTGPASADELRSSVAAIHAEIDPGLWRDIERWQRGVSDLHDEDGR